MPERIAKTSGGKTTEYVWSGDNIVREEETGKSIDYLYGINRVSRTIKGDNYRGTYYERGSREEIPVDGYSEYYFCDGRGNVMQMVSSDYSGGITQIAFGVDASKMPELKIAEVYDDGDRDINSTDFQTYVINAPVTRSYYYDPYGGQWNEDNGYDTNPFRYAGEQWDRETGSIYLRARFYSPGTGRFMTVDPIKDGENWYAYCAGNPVMFRDPSGLEYGDKFKSVDEAAKDFAKCYAQKSIDKDREYGAVVYYKPVYKTEDVERSILCFHWTTTKKTDEIDTEASYYSYTEPKIGSQSGVNTSKAPKGTDAQAQIHTHGAYTPRYYDEVEKCYKEEQDGFSSDDIATVTKLEQDTFVITPWGNMYKGTFAKKYADKDTVYRKVNAMDTRLNTYKVDVRDEQYKQSLGG